MEQNDVLTWAAARHNAFMIHNGIQVAAVQKDSVEVTLEVGANSLNPLGKVHGGAYFTMADCCAGITARTDGRSYVTQNADVHFLSSADHGVITARSRLLKRGRTTCVVEVQIRDAAKALLFHGTFTMFCLPEPAAQ